MLEKVKEHIKKVTNIEEIADFVTPEMADTKIQGNDESVFLTSQKGIVFVVKKTVHKGGATWTVTTAPVSGIAENRRVIVFREDGNVLQDDELTPYDNDTYDDFSAYATDDAADAAYKDECEGY